MHVVDEDVVDVVFEDGGFARRMSDVSTPLGWADVLLTIRWGSSLL